ncbi:MAG TPA: glucokinase [Rhizomicrobium sp.]|nr:glucokinase [Rhizomicrobium sp.]
MTDFALIADVGGTNVRFAPADRPREAKKYPTRNFASMEEAARAYLDETGAKPEMAVLAVAGPVKDGAIHVTNLGWEFSERSVAKALGIARVKLINDFEAIALSLPHLAPEDKVAIGPARDAKGTIAVVGPGTGFGVAGLVADGTALVTEGGHADFAPNDDIEIEMLKALRRRFGHVSVERLLSGPGLVVLYQTLSEIAGRGSRTPEQHAITAGAASDPASFEGEVFARFCAILGAAAGNIALTMGATGGVMVAGGILPQLREPLAASPFRARFEAKGRFEGYMKAIPTALIVQDYAGLIGASAKAMQIRSGAR